MISPPLHASIARPDAQVRLIFRVLAGIVAFTGVLVAFVGGRESAGEAVAVASLVVFLAAGLWLLPRTLVTRGEITATEIRIQTMVVFRAVLPLSEVKRAFADPGLFTGGHGMRWVAKGHRAFISGGEQVSLEMNDGRIYTLSVRSADVFLDAMRAALATGPAH